MSVNTQNRQIHHLATQIKTIDDKLDDLAIHLDAISADRQA